MAISIAYSQIATFPNNTTQLINLGKKVEIPIHKIMINNINTKGKQKQKTISLQQANLS